MQTYIFYFSDHVSAMRSFDFVECEDESHARRVAELLLLREPERRAVEAWAVEAWSAARPVFEMERAAAA
jgi:hypothetical protein